MGTAQIMVVGTFHFHQEGVQYLDIQSPKRQAEIQDLVQKLSLFCPNKIAVEKRPEQEELVNLRYQKYVEDGIIDVDNLHGSSTVVGNLGDVNEIVMLGCQIGKLCQVDKLHAIDFMNEWTYNEAFEHAKANNPRLASEIENKHEEYTQYLLSNIGGSISDIIKFLNSPEAIQKQHSDMFLIMNQIGSSDHAIGTQFVSSWYDRNLRIFSNLQRLASDDDRILLIIGMAHAATLNELISNYYKMEFVSPEKYI